MAKYQVLVRERNEAIERMTLQSIQDAAKISELTGDVERLKKLAIGLNQALQACKL